MRCYLVSGRNTSVKQNICKYSITYPSAAVNKRRRNCTCDLKSVHWLCKPYIMKIIARVLTLTLLPLGCFAQFATPGGNLKAGEDSSAVNNILSRLNGFSASHITEKTYLQFDKPYYAAGDTIYFKAYITLGEQHKPSNLSGVLHVDLININSKKDQSIKLRIDGGLSWGDFALPDSLPAGNYRVRAYTQWMRNAGEDYFFDKTIQIGSLKDKPVPESFVKKPTQLTDSKADIQFFPEGGSMVTGIRSKIAFKAMGINGLGINVKGVIIDNENKQILSFSSTHLGMGYFYLSPEEGKTYAAELTYADGTQNTIDLPRPNSKAIVLSINNDSIPKASVKIVATNAYFLENRGKEYSLVIYSGGIATVATCKLDSPVITMDILKRRLHTGIATITLFSPTAEPLAERLLFIQNYDQLSLGLSSDHAVYTKRAKVNIKLNAINRAGKPSEGHFSIAVTDESKVPVDENAENTIISNLLLTSDLKGYIEQPNYYFADTSGSARNNLDVLMLTQGYRRFEWKQVLDDKYPPTAYQPEKGLEISGTIKNLLDRPINNGTVTLLPVKRGPLMSSVSDKKGIFHFSDLVFADSTRFVLSAVNSKGKNWTKITYFNDKAAPVPPSNQLQNTSVVSDTAMAVYLDNTKNDRNELINFGRGKGIMLKEVKIRDRKLDDHYITQSLAGAGNADQVMHADQIERISGPLSNSLIGRLHGVGFLYGGHGEAIAVLRGQHPAGPMLVVVDGAEMIGLPFDVNTFNSSQIETVEVLKYGNTAVYGMDGANGVLIITTKQGGGLSAKDIASVGILPIAPVGFYKAREFYSPKYDNINLVTKQKDLRSTIYWLPELKTDKNGNALFEYYNADGKGSYQVTIEGIDKDGNIGRQVYRYKVR